MLISVLVLTTSALDPVADLCIGNGPSSSRYPETGDVGPNAMWVSDVTYVSPGPASSEGQSNPDRKTTSAVAGLFAWYTSATPLPSSCALVLSSSARLAASVSKAIRVPL